MLPKAHLTSHSRMSGYRWVTTPLWLSRLLRPFLYISSVYSYHLFLISSASVSSLSFLSFTVPIFAWNILLVSPIFLERSPSLFHSIVRLYFFCIFHLRRFYLFLLFSGILHSVECIFPFLFYLLYFFFPQLYVRSPQTTTLPSCISFSSD